MAALQSYRWFTVTNVHNEGAGSLRQAILDANNSCAAEPCKIAFEIGGPIPPAGYFAITPSYPLPPITAARVSVDATTQTAFSGDSNVSGPEVALDGRFLSHGRGIEIHSRCEAIVQGLAIGNVPDHGIVFTSDGTCLSDQVDQRLIALNYIGLDPTGSSAWPNLRGVYTGGTTAELMDNLISGNTRSGVWAESEFFGAHSNRIGVTADDRPLPNGASGIYLTPRVRWAEVLLNKISNNEQMGIAVAREAKLIDIRRNSMKQNGGIGIDVGLDGKNAPLVDDRNTQSNAPTLLSAVYDSTTNSTVVTAVLATGPLGPYANTDQLDFYLNDGPDADGEQWIGSSFGGNLRTDGSAFSIPIAGDHRGKWINATSTRVHFIAIAPPEIEVEKRATPQSVFGGESSTSELSHAVLVQ
jgi:hypothetical protein